jgi:LuxR family transcriptional regulator, quorum-sensing system regulator BjaR1
MIDAPNRPPLDIQGMLKEISTLSTQFDMFRFLKKTTETFGLKSFMVMRLPGATTVSLQSVSIFSSWPVELIAAYEKSGLIATSPVTARLRNSSIPFVVDLEHEAKRAGGRATEVLALFEGFQMNRGAFFPVSEPTGERGTVSFYGDRPVPTAQEMLELFMISTHVYDRLHEIGRKDIRTGDELTEREVDCLNWTAAGKTSAEISDILGLSEHTVNHYLNRATRKLDTVNRTQAVAKALRMGIIS